MVPPAPAPKKVLVLCRLNPMHLKSIVLFALFVPLSFSQTATPASPLPSVSLDSVVLPSYIAGGVSCSQFNGCAGFVSGIFTETSKTGGLYGAITADLDLVKISVAGKQGFGLEPTFKFGEHKVLYNTITATKDASGNITKMNGNMLLLGVDAGAAFSTTTTTNVLGQTTNTGGVNVNLAGSFTLTYLRQLNPHFAVAVPVQLNWVAGAAPDGGGVWTPTIKLALVWTPKP